MRMRWSEYYVPTEGPERFSTNVPRLTLMMWWRRTVPDTFGEVIAVDGNRFMLFDLKNRRRSWPRATARSGLVVPQFSNDVNALSAGWSPGVPVNRRLVAVDLTGGEINGGPVGRGMPGTSRR